MDLTSYLMGKKASGGGSSSGVAKFELTLNESSYQYELNYTPKDILDALNENKIIYFSHVSGDFNTDEYVYEERLMLLTFVKDFEEGGDNQYKVEMGSTTIGTTKAGGRGMVFVSSGLNETFVFSKAVF